MSEGSSNRRSLEGQVTVVTGAGRGIGKAVAEAFGAEGATVVCAARTAGEIESTAAEIIAKGGRALAITTDVGDADAVARLYQASVKEFGGLDTLFLNAGESLDWQPIETSDPEKFRKTLETNLIGPYHCSRLAIPYLKQRGGGRIIMMGSGSGYFAAPGVAAYACSKAALWMLVRVLAEEVRDAGITVNEILPGGVRTTLGKYAPPGRVATSGLREPEEVAPLAVFLASQPPSGPTGQSFSLRRRSS